MFSGLSTCCSVTLPATVILSVSHCILNLTQDVHFSTYSFLSDIHVPQWFSDFENKAFELQALATPCMHLQPTSSVPSTCSNEGIPSYTRCDTSCPASHPCPCLFSEPLLCVLLCPFPNTGGHNHGLGSSSYAQDAEPEYAPQMVHVELLFKLPSTTRQARQAICKSQLQCCLDETFSRVAAELRLQDFISSRNPTHTMCWIMLACALLPRNKHDRQP